jgi:hypothetical protein
MPLMPNDTARRALADLERQAALQLSDNQRRRALWIIQNAGVPTVWTRQAQGALHSDCVVVTDVPTAIEIEDILLSLGKRAVVIIPYSEDALFDQLKSHLFEFGTVGAVGDTGPHQLWWGGLSSEPVAADPARSEPLIVSCYAPNLLSINNMRRLIQSAEALQLSHAISQYDAVGLWETCAVAKVEYIWTLWTATGRPILWVDPDATLHGCPDLPVALCCDFAVRKRNGHTLDSSVLYFGQSQFTSMLLQIWHKLCATCPGASDSALLDQAWSLISSQCDLDTVWLPRSYCSSRSNQLPGERVVITYDDVPRQLQDMAGQPLPLAEAEMPSPILTARDHARTGAPEALLIMRAETAKFGPVAVLVNASHTEPELSAAIVETIAAAFAWDPGGFSHLEVMLCRSEADFAASIKAAQDYWVAVTTPAERFPADMFGVFGSAIAGGEIGAPRTAQDGHRPHTTKHNAAPPARGLMNVKQSKTVLMHGSALRSPACTGALT